MRFQLGSAAAFAACAVLPVLVSAGCLFSGTDTPPDGELVVDSTPRPGPSSGSRLFTRLGGVDGIRAIVDEMVSRMAADRRIQRFFVDTDFRRFKAQLVVQVCELSGGPCRYRGRSMRAVHRGRRIRPAHFEAMLEDARDALKEAQVGERERHELLSILRSLKPQVVEPRRQARQE
jgi:hemoglobin